MEAVWQALEYPGIEHLRLTEEAAVISTDSLVIAAEHGRAFSLRYRLRMGVDWHTQEARIEILEGEHLTLRHHPKGRWMDGAGQVLDQLEGCDSLDITATPFTNTLPIRMLNLSVGELGVTRAAWVEVPSLNVRSAEQRYTRLSEYTYLFESLESGFMAELEVDGAGLVVSYPGLFRRLV